MTIEEKKEQVKDKRSRNVKTVLDLLKTRDGSDAPPIESLKDVDEFNRQMLFGASGNENINWQMMGVEGLIRCYYKIIELIKGTKRNNLITDMHVGSLTTRSSLDKTAEWVTAGRPHISGFYQGWISGQDGQTSNAPEDLRNRALRGELDLGSSSFTHNRDKNNSGYWPADGPDATALVPEVRTLIGGSGWSRSGSYEEPYTYSELIDIAPSRIISRRMVDLFPITEYNRRHEETTTHTDPETGETYESTNIFYEIEYWYGNNRVDINSFNDKIFRTRYSFDTGIDNPDNVRVYRNGQELYTHNLERITRRIYEEYNSLPVFNAEIDEEENEILVTTHINGETNHATSNSPNIIVTTDQVGRDDIPRRPQRTKIKVVGLVNPGEYISIYNAYNGRINGWFSIDGVGTQPSVSGTHIQINIVNQYIILNDREISIPSFNYGQNVRMEVGEEITSGKEYQIYRWYISGFNESDFYDYYNPEIESMLVNIKNSILEVQQYIQYTKVEDLTYFTNPDIIPFYPDYEQQDVWIAGTEEYIDIIDDFLNTFGSLSRIQKNEALLQLRSDLEGLGPELNNIIDDITPYIYIDQNDSGNGHKPTDLDSLYGIRHLLVKSIINNQDGSKIQVKSIDNTIGMMKNNIVGAEIEFAIYGISRQSVPYSSQQAWIGGLPTPDIVGIIQYIIPDLSGDPMTNENYGEMIVAGQVISWMEVAHATGYNVYKSTDWDGETGTWDLILPAGNTFTIQNVDPNTGKVLSYFIDENVEDDETPYYKIKAYDDGQVGVTDYQRIPAESFESEEKNIEDFDGAGPSAPYIGPSEPAPRPEGEIPPYLFKWTTVKMGSDANDVGRTIFESETPFDGVGSNLEVFINGSIVSKNNYSLLNDKEIQFNTAVNPNDKILLIVYFGGGEGGGGSSVWKDPVNSYSLLPTVGNVDGDIRLVLNEAKLYVWVAGENNWENIRIDIDEINLAHSDLIDMPEDGAHNTDHDERYYTEVEVDSMLSNVNNQLQSLQYLIPQNADVMGGGLTFTGTSYSGRISAGNSLSILQQHQVATIVRQGSFTLTSSNEDYVFNDADKGEILVLINNIPISTFSLSNNWNEDNRNVGQTYPPAFSSNGIIEIISVGPWNAYGAYQKGVFKIHLDHTNLNSGENNIIVRHTVDGQNRDTETFTLFYDDNQDDITFSNIDIEEAQLQTHKYISGVRFYSRLDRLKISFRVDNLFKNTYKTPNQIRIDANELGNTQYFIDYENEDVKNIVVGNINDHILYERVLTINKNDHYTILPLLRLKGYRPYDSSNEQTNIPKNILINTYTVKSDDKNEYLVDEHYRLPYGDYDTPPSQYTGVWNSSQPLGDGQLQIYNRQIIYPGINYTQHYYPTQNINYTSYHGDRYYFRVFRDFGVPHNNGTFFIDGLNLSDDTTKIYMKLPSQTGWLNLKEWFNEADFTGLDDDGCLTHQDGYNFSWTSGTHSTAHSGFMVIIKVVMTNPAYNPINKISINW